MIKFEYAVDSSMFPSVTIHRRLVTPFFYKKLKPLSAEWSERKAFGICGVCDFFLYLPMLHAPKGKVYHIGEWECRETNDNIKEALKGIREPFCKLVNLDGTR